MPNTGLPSSRSRTRDDRRVLLVLHAIIVVSLAIWVRTLSVSAGALAALAATGAAAITWRGGRWLATIALAAVGVANAMLVAGNARDRGIIERDAARSPEERNAPYERALVDAINTTDRMLTRIADSAASGMPPKRLPQTETSDVGFVTYSMDGRPLFWDGRAPVPTNRVWEQSGVIVTPLYYVQYAASVKGALRSVATSVLATVPPADRLAHSLTRAVGAPHGVTYQIDVGPGYGGGGGAIVDLGGSRLRIRAHVPDAQTLLIEANERARTKGTVLLLIATTIALAILWRRAERLPERLLAISLPLAAIAIVPLNRLSNVTRLLDPSTYYVPVGGPFTASVGALALTSALVLFAVMAGLRDRMHPRRRWVAGVAVLVIAVGGPFLLRDLARGVAMPPDGATTGLWLAWELALFLAATSLLIAGVWAGQWALGARRGLPLWIAPLIAAGATAIGPLLLLWTGSARWPAWYLPLWVLAIAALAFARRSRAVLFPGAIVAACGATILLWGVTLRERIELAAEDVANLGTIDAGTSALVQRFARDLASAPPPTSRADLLARYASADLSAVNHPVSLGHWPIAGTPVFLSLLGGDVAQDDVARVVAEARVTGEIRVRELPPSPVTTWVLAVPHSGGEVTTAVIRARTRLIQAKPFTELFGLSPPSAQPPYQLADMGPVVGVDTTHTRWVIRGSHFHADWTLPAGDGARVRVNASVPLDPLETLYPRGALVILLDLAVVLMLFAIDLLADGALWRWMRGRRAQWQRSFRLNLTLALFAFFVVPALAFAAWSYRRLQDDDRAARELLVRESLRPASALTDTSLVTRVEYLPGDVPFFVYRGGELVTASDSLLVSVAPMGLWLIQPVVDLLKEGEELVAAAPIAVAGRETLFGFRSLTTRAPQVVAAVPARRGDATLDKRRSDLGVLVVLATVLGALAALGLSGVAARQLARPIGALRGAAMAVAGGSRAPLDASEAPAEFVPVFRAFDKMATDLATSESQLSRAERVFAWGEMARQVAHEIKNPLTPIRLGVQHLLRAWHDARPDFGTILQENSARVLREIDHLDATARSFSRYGTTPSEPSRVDSVDVAAVARDVAALEALGGNGHRWTAIGADGPCWARARADELREVLLNLCENARLAGATNVELHIERSNEHVTLAVIDNGEGIAPNIRARVFDPHFSTRTSGSGLGLAISRRLVEGWGGSIDLTSEHAIGTTVELRLEPAEPPA
ncbi:MAG TPA: ATP-binding protein [Gemmatimonadaceae bacterium]|nr:ATP-binding protein [Gemmatimonadaceae bacterium]